MLSEYKSIEDFIEDIRGYGTYWALEVTEEDVREDKAFMYLDIESEIDIKDSFIELGRYLDAKSMGVVNSGERYVLSVQK